MTAITTTPAKRVSKADAYLTELGKVRDPKIPSSLAILSKVGEHIAPSSEVKQAETDVKSLTEELEHARQYRDGLVDYRNKAILTAQRVGFSVTAITEAFSVSRGTVQNVANAVKVAEALKVGAKSNGITGTPSPVALIPAVSNLKAGELPTLIEHAKSTGTLPPKGEPKVSQAPTVKAVLARAEKLSEAIAAMTVTADDADTLKQLRSVLVHATTKASNPRLAVVEAA